MKPRKKRFSAVPSQTASTELQISVNGDLHTVPGGATLADLLSRLGMTERRVAVARNREVVPKSQFPDEVLNTGDQVEILEAVGGG